jgi:hypothetical protein
MKTCTKCREIKPIATFHVSFSKTKKKHFVQSWCNTCRVKDATERGRSRKIRAVEQMGGACSVCGAVLPACCYDFHHIDGDKANEPGRALRGAFETAMQEVKKCVLVCANCHRKITWEAA